MMATMASVPKESSSSASAVVQIADVKFAHAVNTAQLLDNACKSPAVNVLEADVIACQAEDGTIKAMMGHDPGQTSNLTLKDWVESAAKAGKGIKIDMKEYRVLEDVMAVLIAVDLEQHRDGLPHWPFLRQKHGNETFFDRPAVIVNADVLTGTTGDKSAGCKFNPSGAVLSRADQVAAATAFIDTVAEKVPSAVLSLGWTTDGEGRRYTCEMVDDMLAVVYEAAAMGAAITFPVRATYVIDSWPQLRRLLDAGPLTSLTVWSNVPLHPLEEAWIREHLPRERTMYDLPPPLPQPPASANKSKSVPSNPAARLLAGTVSAVFGGGAEGGRGGGHSPSLVAWAAAGATAAVVFFAAQKLARGGLFR